MLCHRQSVLFFVSACRHVWRAGRKLPAREAPSDGFRIRAAERNKPPAHLLLYIRYKRTPTSTVLFTRSTDFTLWGVVWGCFYGALCWVVGQTASLYCEWMWAESSGLHDLKCQVCGAGIVPGRFVDVSWTCVQQQKHCWWCLTPRWEVKAAPSSCSGADIGWLAAGL